MSWVGEVGRQTYNPLSRNLKNEVLQWSEQQANSTHPKERNKLSFFLFSLSYLCGNNKESIITVWIIQIIRGENLKK